MEIQEDLFDTQDDYQASFDKLVNDIQVLCKKIPSEFEYPDETLWIYKNETKSGVNYPIQIRERRREQGGNAEQELSVQTSKEGTNLVYVCTPVMTLRECTTRSDHPGCVRLDMGFLDFIGGDLIVGHNVGFDVRFIFNNSGEHLQRPFSNDYINTMRIARKAGLGLRNYRLDTLCDVFGIDSTNHHRALADCERTHVLFEKFRELFPSEEHLQGLFVRHYDGKGRCCPRINPRMIESEVPESEIDKDNPLYGKTVVFTGALEKYPRSQAMQLVANLGGKNANTVTKATDFLVLGCNDYCPTIKDGKSSKHKKAEEYARKGTGISIIDERTFYDIVCSDGE